MLGMFPFQNELELLHAKNCTGDSDVLANQCLLLFFMQAHVAVVARRVMHRANTLRIVIEDASKGVKRARDGAKFSDHQRNVFMFSPCYFRLSGLSEQDGQRSVETLQLDIASVVEEMESYFWKCVEENKYFAGDELRSCVGPLLTPLFRAGLTGQQKGFAPSCPPFHLYLQGLPGCGKSSFVRVFDRALERVLCKYNDHSLRSTVVKVPLNAATPASLQATLLVRGISDWSIERILEQGLSKGHVVVFHLEEVPEDPRLQDQLIGMCQGMIKTLVNRYPECASLVFTLYTSNYSPSPSLKVPSIELKYPSAVLLQNWFVSGIHSLVLSHFAPPSLIEAPPPSAPVASSVHSLHSAAWLSMFLTHPLTFSTEDTRNIVTSQSSIAFAVVNALRSNWTATGRVQVSLTFKGTHACTVHIAYGEGVSHALTLSSDNGYFFFAQSAEFALMRMTAEGFLKPGVLVLQASPSTSLTQRLGHFRALLADESHELTELVVMEEKDKELVFGHHSEIRGGLFKYIDDFTNPASPTRLSSGLLVVILHVNELGQFAVRELLEEGVSTTHRLRLHKDRLLFVLAVSGEVSPPVQSRAHVVLGT